MSATDIPHVLLRSNTIATLFQLEMIRFQSFDGMFSRKNVLLPALLSAIFVVVGFFLQELASLNSIPLVCPPSDGRFPAKTRFLNLECMQILLHCYSKANATDACPAPPLNTLTNLQLNNPNRLTYQTRRLLRIAYIHG